MSKAIQDKLVYALDGIVKFIQDGVYDKNGVPLDISEYIKVAEEALRIAKMKKNAWDNNQFKKSNVKGNSEAWKNAAKGMGGTVGSLDDDMATLDLQQLTDLRSLTKARNRAMLKAHPDKGGSDEQARIITDAYNRLKMRLP